MFKFLMHALRVAKSKVKNPGPEDPALVHPGGVITFVRSVPRFRFASDGIFDRFQVSGVRIRYLLV